MSERGVPKGTRRGPARRTPPSGLNPSVAVACVTPGCGTESVDDLAKSAGLPRPRVPDGWIYVIVRSSAVPGRWFCSGPCAHRGIAVAQLRPLPSPPK